MKKKLSKWLFSRYTKPISLHIKGTDQCGSFIEEVVPHRMWTNKLAAWIYVRLNRWPIYSKIIVGNS